MSNAAKKIKGIFISFLTVGNFLTIGGYIVNTFLLPGNEINIIFIVVVLFIFAIYTSFSVVRAGKNENREVAKRDLWGDTFKVLTSLVFLCIWVILPMRGDLQIGNELIYWTNLIFLGGMFLIALFEILQSIDLVVERMYSVTPIATGSQRSPWKTIARGNISAPRDDQGKSPAPMVLGSSTL